VLRIGASAFTAPPAQRSAAHPQRFLAATSLPVSLTSTTHAVQARMPFWGSTSSSPSSAFSMEDLPAPVSPTTPITTGRISLKGVQREGPRA
jgi:hypothetical protein